MKILIGCEKSGVVRDAFTKAGYDAWSCDLLATDIPGQHIIGDVRRIIKGFWNGQRWIHWDAGIFHPECKYLCWSGERWIKEKPGREKLRAEAYEFFRECTRAPFPNGVENSHSKFLEKIYKKPTQSIRPYHFGDPYKKMTCLWLHGLPPLVPTDILPIGHRYPECHQMRQSADRSEKRAKSYPGIAAAMADQWGRYMTSYLRKY
jgi:hypothetical protein